MAKAEKIVNGTITNKTTKFLCVTMKEKKLNQNTHRQGQNVSRYKGCVTNLAVPDEEVITSYHRIVARGTVI